MKDYKSIFSALDTLAVTQPDRLVYSFANDNGQFEQELTWNDLRQKTDALTGFLRTKHKLAVGARVLLVYPPSMDFVVAFVSCLRAGLVPVPVYPPNPAANDNGMEAFNRIAVDCDAQLVLTNRLYSRGRKLANIQDLLTFKSSKWEISLPWVTTDDVKVGDFAPVHGPQPTPETIALIQYTSGSTSAPKGVVLTHGNLSHQLEYTRIFMRTDANSRAVFWVPQYHDLGLIGGILNALGGNAQLVLFSPLSFIKRPALWFDLMHKVKATHTAAPNFAYELALRKTTPAQRAAWDLSSLQMVMSAAEPVRASTMQRFLEAFSVSGLKPEAYLPAYGLAEHTVAVTFNGGVIKHFDKNALEFDRQVIDCKEPADHTISLVSSGCWAEDILLHIVDPDTGIECAADKVGEVWVTSPSKAAGYWKLEETHGRSFNAKMEGDNDNRYLRTGDFGFVQNGQLYICGRLKDMLILAGRNLYPQDIEDSIQQASDAIRPGCMAAFSVDVVNGDVTEEKLVLLAEVRDTRMSKEALQQLAQSLQRIVLENHQTPCHAIVLAAPGTALKTTSGKIRRQACRQLWADGSLSRKSLYLLQAGASAVKNVSNVVEGGFAKPLSDKHDIGKKQLSNALPMSPREALMQRIAAQMLNLPAAENVDIHQSLTEQGMGSLSAVDFCQEYETQSGEELSIADFFNFPAISMLARALESAHLTQNETLDSVYKDKPCDAVHDLHSLRHYILHNRFTTSGFRIGEWGVRPARVEDIAEIHRLDQQEYGWLGEGATDDLEFIENQVRTLNSVGTPWVWLLERASDDNAQNMEVMGWYIMQPTHKSPHEITSWADATDEGRLKATFDPAGKYLYIVAAGISRKYTKQAHRLMVLNALSLMKAHKMHGVFACLAMPGFADAHAAEGIAPEAYVQLTHANGLPKDAFLAFFRELWTGDHRPLRLLVNGYPPDLFSGGHGVCACVDMKDYRLAIDRVFDKLTQQRIALFANAGSHTQREESVA